MKFGRFASPVLNVVERIGRPLTKVLVGTTSVINKALVKKRYDLSVDELSKALELTSDELPEEKEMLSEIIKFYNKTADEIMTSRLDMEDIDVKSSFREVVDFIIMNEIRSNLVSDILDKIQQLYLCAKLEEMDEIDKQFLDVWKQDDMDALQSFHERLNDLALFYRIS